MDRKTKGPFQTVNPGRVFEDLIITPLLAAMGYDSNPADIHAYSTINVWDLDWVFEQSLLTLPVNGKATDLVVTGGKTAIFDAMDRATGKYVFSRDLGLQNIGTS